VIPKGFHKSMDLVGAGIGGTCNCALARHRRQKDNEVCRKRIFVSKIIKLSPNFVAKVRRARGKHVENSV
jgi:hypothetical protein